MRLLDFRSYQLSVQFHLLVKSHSWPSYLRDQLLRASSSIALNLAEGFGKGPGADQMRYYRISLGSLRECQAALDLSGHPTEKTTELARLADQLGAHLYRLCVSPRR